jgi:hypothetical protein
VIAEQILCALEDAVWRYRAVMSCDERVDLCADAMTTEVAHQVAVTRAALEHRPTTI